MESSGVTLFSSYEQGEQRTGLYRSDSFEPGASLSFYVAGHDGFPDKPLKQANFVRLRDGANGEVLREASPPRNDVAQKVEWRTDDLAGRRVFVELVDGDTAGAFAWLAVGRFSDERLNPSDAQLRQAEAAALIGDFAISELRPAIIRIVSDVQQPRATRAGICERNAEIACGFPAGSRRPCAIHSRRHGHDC
jgi:hypothetical protein